jgi:2-polyprenyl-3-methyl-5-hydroxy-6-metoxy-1,4-benzoquinol methylase
MENQAGKKLEMVSVQCCVCDQKEATKIGAGRDFEYDTSDDSFNAMQCSSCGLVYLNPRPSVAEFETIYPANYHAFDFSEENFGIVHKIRSRLEAKRVLSWCKGLPSNAKILDVGCGDGFHLELLKNYGDKNWSLEGIDIDERAVEMAKRRDLNVSLGTISDIETTRENFYDFAFTVQTIEHVEQPDAFLRAIKKVLKPGGKLVVVTDNTDSYDFRIFKNSHWGGYHFPRHWNLFNRKNLAKLAEKVGFTTEKITTQVSPVNWVYSFHNRFVDTKKPNWLIDQFTLKSTVSLSAFTALDIILQKLGNGGLLNATFRKKN